MAVTIYNAATGETQTVDSTEGYDPEVWAEVGNPPPAGAWVYDGTAWVRFPVQTLGQIRDAAKQSVMQTRDATMNGGCPCTIGIIDSNEQSRLFVSGSVSMAQIAAAASQPFTIRWRLQDNSYADLDADDMIAMGVELGQFVNACCQAAFDLKDEIDAAADEAEVAAVDIAAAFAALI